MKGTWIRILGLLLFVGLLAVGGGWWMMRGQAGPAPTAALAEEKARLPTVTQPSCGMSSASLLRLTRAGGRQRNSPLTSHGCTVSITRL
jgi:hypothetical protein